MRKTKEQPYTIVPYRAVSESPLGKSYTWSPFEDGSYKFDTEAEAVEKANELAKTFRAVGIKFKPFKTKPGTETIIDGNPNCELQ